MKNTLELKKEILSAPQEQVPLLLKNIKGQDLSKLVIEICDGYTSHSDEEIKSVAVKIINLANRNLSALEQIVKSNLTSLLNILRVKGIISSIEKSEIKEDDIASLRYKILEAFNNIKVDPKKINNGLETTIKEIISDNLLTLIDEHGPQAALLVLQCIETGNTAKVIQYFDTLIPKGSEDLRKVLFNIISISINNNSKEINEFIKQLKRGSTAENKDVINLFHDLINEVEKTLKANITDWENQIVQESKIENKPSDNSWRKNVELTVIDNLELTIASNIINIPTLQLELEPTNPSHNIIAHVANLILNVLKADKDLSNTSELSIELRKRKLEDFKVEFFDNLIGYLRNIKDYDSSLKNLIRHYAQLLSAPIPNLSLLLSYRTIQLYKFIPTKEVKDFSPEKIKSLSSDNAIKLFKKGLFKYSELKDFNADQIENLTSIDAMEGYKDELFIPQDFKGFNADQIKALTPTFSSAKEGYKDKLFSPQDFKGFEGDQIANLISCNVIEGYRSNLFTIQNFNGFNAAQIKSLTSYSARRVYIETLLTPQDFKGFNAGQIEALITSDAIKDYKDKLFTPQDFNGFNADQIKALTTSNARICYGDKLFTPQVFKDFKSSQIEALTSKASREGYKDKLFSPQDFKGFEADQIEVLTSNFAMKGYNNKFFVIEDFKDLTWLEIGALTTFHAMEGYKSKLFTIGDFKNFNRDQIEALTTFDAIEGYKNKLFTSQDFKDFNNDQIINLTSFSAKECYKLGFSIDNLKDLNIRGIDSLKTNFYEFNRIYSLAISSKTDIDTALSSSILSISYNNHLRTLSSSHKDNITFARALTIPYELIDDYITPSQYLNFVDNLNHLEARRGVS